jgi:tetratricopeptide (TPR) repeat protein
MHFKIATTYMNEANWKIAIKSLQLAMKKHVLQPDFNLALGRCYMELGNFEDAITHLGNVVRVRPKNINGWVELLNCLYKGRLFEEGFEYAALAFEQTDSKPIFVYYKSAFLFATGKSKQGLNYLEYALIANRKLVKKFIVINPSILQNNMVVDLIAAYKKTKKKK